MQENRTDLARIKKLQQTFGILGESEKIYEIIEIIDQVARYDISVLIEGESGTGKELIARAIHRHSLRRHKRLVTVNCGAIPAGIIESELFGHKKGSFTGAIEERPGYFEMADGGTIFLDEIGETPLETQVKLLRVLENGEFMKVGGSEVQRVDVRLIAATNKDLKELVDQGKFRKDLYYRLKTVTIRTPALREHPEDIPIFVDKFAIEFCQKNNIPYKGFSPGAIEVMKKHRWEGNIRELKNFVESILVLEGGNVITSSRVAAHLKTDKESPSPNLPVKLPLSPEEAERDLILRQLFEIRTELHQLTSFLLEKSGHLITPPDFINSPAPSRRIIPPPLSPEEEINISEEEIQQEEKEWTVNPELVGKISIVDAERELIKETLKKFKFNKRKTARALKISERTLYRKIKEYNLEKLSSEDEEDF